MPERRPRICFVAPNNYAVLSGREDVRHIGGAEVQRMLVGRELARRGYEVSFVTLDHGQPDGIVHEGVRVYKMCRVADGLPLLRFFHPRWTSLCAAMRRADADVYIQRTSGVETGQVAMWCRWNHRRFILSIANDPECDVRLGGKRNFRERWFYFYGLRHAHAVVAQTRTQERMLAENFGVQATVVRSCTADIEPAGSLPDARVLAERRVLWVGRFSRQKRVDRLAALVEVCPTVQFDVIGDPERASDSIRTSIDKLRALPNAVLHGYVPYGRMDEFYRRAALLISTSEWEGYPNVFLEAWARGIPVVSTVDPDNVVKEHRLGAVAVDLATMRTGVDSLLSSPEAWRICSENARRFFVREHTVGATVDALEKALAAS